MSRAARRRHVHPLHGAPVLLIKDMAGLFHEVIDTSGAGSGLPVWVVIRCGHAFPPQMGAGNIRDTADPIYADAQITCMKCAAPLAECDHGVVFDEDAAEAEQLSSHEIQKRWPRLTGLCPLGCGFNGIGYASFKHYVYGDW